MNNQLYDTEKLLTVNVATDRNLRQNTITPMPTGLGVIKKCQP